MHGQCACRHLPAEARPAADGDRDRRDDCLPPRPCSEWRTLRRSFRDAASRGSGTRPVSRRPRRAHLPLFLGHRQSAEWADPGSLSDAFLLEHRRSGIRTDDVPHRRRARLRHARGGPAEGPRDTAFLPRCPAEPRRARRGWVQGVFLSLPRHEDGGAFRGLGAFDRRYGHPSRGRAFLPVLLQRDGSGGSRNPRPGRRNLQPRRLALGPGARARHQPRLDAGRRLSRIRLARLQRGDAGLPAGAGLADLSRRAKGLDRVDEHLRQDLAQGIRAGVPGLRAAVRAPVHARLAGFSQDPGRLHAQARSRLFREQPQGDLRATGLRDRQSRGAARITVRRSGA